MIKNNYIKCFGPIKTNNIEVLSLHHQFSPDIIIRSILNNIF